MHIFLNPRFKLAALVIVLLSVLFACKSNPSPNEIQPEMRDSYAASYALFRDIWSQDRFGDPENRKDIISLIDRLSKNFHGVQSKTAHSKYDSGFAVALELNQEMLLDAKRRLNDGHIDYAAWRLRGMMHNCIACHTRYQAPIRFVGEAPSSASQKPEDLLQVANFLVATRQFDRASTELLKLASTPGGINSSEQPEFRALKLWLVVQLKDAPRFQLIAAKLKEISALDHFRGETTGIVSRWIQDLERFSKDLKPKATLEEATALVSSLGVDSNFMHDDESLVVNLYAATILHNLLPSLVDKQKREATYLLGLVYHHIHINELAIFSGLYLEQCIREFPNTAEAKKAFELYQEEIEFFSSGSGGVQMEEEDKIQLENLRKLAVAP